MKTLTIMVTGVGAPGTVGTLYSLNQNFDGRKIRTVGVDMKGDVVGKYLCNIFRKVPEGPSKNFIPTLLKICQKEKVDVVLPQVTNELNKLSLNREDFENEGIRTAISSHKTIELCNNKYKLLKIALEVKVPAPKFYLAHSFNHLEKYAEKLGYPENPIVIKPTISRGMRGLRIVNEKIDRKALFYLEKPTGVYARLEDLTFLGDFHVPLLVMEYLPKSEFTVDVLAKSGETVVAVPRRRDLVRSGITFNGTVCKNYEIFWSVKKLVKRLGLEYACGFQFKLDENGIPRLLECNPRIQGSMVLSTFARVNIIYGAVKLALGEDPPEFHIRWGTRLLRYWGGIYVHDRAKKGEIQLIGNS